MNLAIAKKYCGFYRKEIYIDFPDIGFCDMRHDKRPHKYPDFFPNYGRCEYNHCPMIKFIDKINELNKKSIPPLPPTPIKAQTINENIGLEIQKTEQIEAI